MALDKETVEILKALLDAQSEQNAENLQAIAEELRKPTQLEQEDLDKRKAQKEADLTDRRENSASVKQEMINRRNEQLNCSHAHADGHTHLVHVLEGTGPGYLLCQWCVAKIRPEVPKERQLDTDAIYDTALFNRLYQTLPNKEIFQ